MSNRNAVNVYQTPREISSTSQVEFVRRLEIAAQNGHPRFVLDCSALEHIRASEIRFLLGCLEEVMKQNGDVRLSMLQPDVKAALQQAGMDRVFEMYETTENAILSYQRRLGSMQSIDIANGDQATEYAA